MIWTGSTDIKSNTVKIIKIMFCLFGFFFSENMDKKIQISAINPMAVIPTRAYNESAGLDLYACTETTILPHQLKKINTGIRIEIPRDTYGQICGRSSLESKQIHCVAGVVDHGYTGPLIVCLQNASNTAFTIHYGDKIAQIIIIKILEPIFELTSTCSSVSTQRGERGFGSSDGGKHEPKSI